MAGKLSVDTKNFIPSILIVAFLLVGFVPNLQAVDKVSPQWVYFTIVNILSVIYLFLNRDRFETVVKKVLTTGISLFFIVFFVWASLSYFYSINNIEALVNIPRHLNTLLMYLFIGIFIYDIKEKNILISWFITLLLAIEVYAVFTQAMDMIATTGSIYADNLKGVTANRNITAFSIALKIPFVLYLIENIKNRYFILTLCILIFFSLLDLSMISSRASFIGVGLIFIGYVFFQIYKYLKIEKNKKGFLNIGFYLVPLIFAIVVNQVYFSKKGVDAIERASTIAINTSDDSISKRLRYYEDVLTHMLDNPIFGTGIGNWKFESIKYDRLQIDGYIVPYHAHSDFIQLGAELGFIGFFLYVFIFVSAIYFTYYIIFKSKIESKDKIFSFFLIISLGVYLIDANLNFPIARPQELAPMALVLALINFYFISSKNEVNLSKKIVSFFKMGFPIGSFLLLLPSLFITQKTYSSQISQMIILNDFNTDQFNIPLNKIESIIPSIPNVTVTTIPMDAIKARYYFHYQKYEKALEYALKSKAANPYLHYGDIIASKIYNINGDSEKAKQFVRNAFFGMPNNNLHIGEYLKIILEQKDDDALEDAYPLLTSTNKINGWKSYLVAKSGLTPAGDQIFIKRAEKAQKLFPFDDEFRKIVKTAKIGLDRINQAYAQSQQAQNKYIEQSFDEAARLYDISINLDPYEYSYYENSALCYYSINDLDNALTRINKVVDEMNPLNGKCEYIKGLIYLKLGVLTDACQLFETSVSSGFETAQEVKKQYCK
tara:strand:+ start:3489 stop:5810 length:2322 start_codon:yes stop_codon:yes gene_type:complete